MSSIRLLPYQPGHLDVMAIRTPHPPRNMIEPALRNLKAAGAHMATLLIENEVIAILCLNLIHEGVAEASAVTANGVTKLPRAFTRLVKNLIESYMRDLKLHRVQMYVRADFKMGRRWAGVLGFSEEAHLREYGPDRQNYLLLARFS